MVSLLLFATGCSLSGDLFEELPCPCGSGWTCDDARDVCVREDTFDAGATDGSVTDAASTDGGIDAGPEGPPPPVATTCWLRAETCDWTVRGFTLVEDTSAGSFTNGLAENATFSPDGCRVYYAEDGDLHRVERTGPGMPFGPVVSLDSVNTMEAVEEAPSIGPDGLELFFASDDGTRGQRSVYRAIRAAPDLPFEPRVRVASTATPGERGWEPRIAPHGLRLYYAPTGAVQFIHVLERRALGDELGPPISVPLDGVEPAYATNRPSVTHDDRVLVGVQQVTGDILTRRPFYATRPDWQASWSRVAPLPAVTGMTVIIDVAVSPDGCEVLARDATDTATTLRYVDP
ncbi:MAG: hypothetical protein KC619_17775 [Myxococcales bacterium]|nr:hypothetical protein [Myxococcales bacterium]